MLSDDKAEFFLALVTNNEVLPSRELLVLDETHLLEPEIVRFTGISISKRKWKKYIPNLKMVDYGYDDVEKWIEFLIDLKTRMLDFTGNDFTDMLSEFQRDQRDKKTTFDERKVVRASDLFESDKEIAELSKTDEAPLGLLQQPYPNQRMRIPLYLGFSLSTNYVK